MPATITVTKLETRESKLALAPAIRQTRITFEARPTDLDVKTVPLDMPLYRMTNVRTMADQSAYIRDHAVAVTYFENGQEDLEAQRVQHGFLYQWAKEPGKNIFKVLDETHRQDQPLLVTRSGVVLDGNRRLAAMRELFADDPVGCAAFGTVEVAILPDADESELAGLETDLQIRPDMKLDYRWVAEALGLRRHINVLGWSWDKARAHWRKPEKALKAILSRLVLAEQYLEYLGEPLHYEYVYDEQQAFETLQTKLAAQTANVDPSLIEAQKAMFWAILKEKRLSVDVVGGASYDYASKLDEIIKLVMRSSAVIVATPPSVHATSEHAAAEPQPKPNAPATGEPIGEYAAGAPVTTVEPDPLDELPVAPTAVPAAVLSALRDPTRSHAIAAAADEARVTIAEQARIRRKGSLLSQNAGKINALAAGLALTDSDTASLGTVAVQLFAAMDSIADTLATILHEKPAAADELDWALVDSTVGKLTEISTQRNH